MVTRRPGPTAPPGAAATSALRRDLASLEVQLAELNQRLAQNEQALAATGTWPLTAAQLKRLQTERQQLAGQRDTVRQQFAELERRWKLDVEALRPAAEPQDAVGDRPLLLMPVRLETRYGSDRRSLRVRIFPDDVHIDALERGLSDSERAAAQAWWTRIWPLVGAAADPAAEGTAWRDLITAVGRNRARWCASACTPSNLAQRGEAVAPAFQAVSPPLKGPAFARLLPDQFTVVVQLADGRQVQATGSTIPPRLPVGLFSQDGRALKQINGVTLVEGAEWIAHFGEAEKAGLALTVPLPDAGPAIRRVLAFGVRRSADDAQSATDFADLLQAHACSDGLAFVPAGTATNNTEDGPAGWQRRLDPVPPATAPWSPPAGSHAEVLAQALGLPHSLFHGLDQAEATDPALAGAAANALWPATWGAFLDRINRVEQGKASLSDDDRERARRFALQHVRGRGPLPVLRIGRQPYGLLPVSLVRDQLQPAPGDAFEARLIDLLRKLRRKWLAAAADLPRIGRGDIERVLPELLGQAPASIALRVRSVLSSPLAELATKLNSAGAGELAVEQLIDEMLWEDLIANARLVMPTGSLSDSRPLSLALTDATRDAAVLRELLAGRSPTLSSVLQVLVQIGLQRTRADVDRESAQGRLDQIVGLAADLPAPRRGRVIGLANRLARGEPVSASVFRAEAEAVEQVQPALHQVAREELQPLEGLSRGFGEMALQSTHDGARQQLGLRATSAWLRAQARQVEMTAAVEAWASRMERDAQVQAGTAEAPATGAPAAEQPADHRLLVAETLDCASHRLDAWLTGLVEARRARLAPAAKTGITIGAYGWVENLTPVVGNEADGGYIHAPSLAQATTAAILRSAYLTHNTSRTDSGAFAIDLTSQRVRQATYLLDGVRQGQPLSALLGYAIERGLHEAQLDRFVLSLRRVAPLQQGRLTDRENPPPAAGLEVLAASNVVDGIDLIEKWQGKVAGWDAAAVRAALSQRPADNPYLNADDPWPALTDPQWHRIEGLLQAAAADLDAVADLLMAESVHQLAQGNVQRVAAALDAAAGGDAPAPVPDVVASRIEGTPVAHRLMLVMPTEPVSWSSTRPRAQVSPELESWAVSRLGAADRIAVAFATDGRVLTMADTGWCALDLVCAAGDAARLRRQLWTSLASQGWAEDQPWIDEPDAGLAEGQRAIGDVAELADALRVLMASGKPLGPTDLCAPGVRETRPELMAIAAGDPARADAAAAVMAWRDRLNHAIDQLDIRSQTLAQQLAQQPVDAAAVRQSLDALSAFGISLPDVKDDGLPTTGDLAYSEAVRRIFRAETALASQGRALRGEDLAAAAEALLGEGFKLPVPLAAPAAPDGWSAALGPAGVRPTQAALRRYIADTSAVREGMRRFNEVLLLTEAVGETPTLRVAQLSGPGMVTPDWWVGDRMPETAQTPDASTVTTTVDLPADHDPRTGLCGLLIDHWVDVLPERRRRGPEPDAPVDTQVTTGVSFEAVAAGARAPQSLLLAISPDGERWTTERLTQLLDETLEMARLRLVSLERTNGVARVLPALYTANWSLQGEPALDLRSIARMKDLSAIAPFIRERES
jgi:hypothetical protein